MQRLTPPQLKSLVSFLIFFLLFVGCDSFLDKKADDHQITYLLDNISMTENNQLVQDLIKNPTDADDEKISNQLLGLSEALLPLIQNPDFNKSVIALARANKRQVVSISDLKKYSSEIEGLVNNALNTEGLNIEEINKNMTHFNGSYTEKYVPSIFIPNLEILDEAMQPIISPNVVANSDNNPEIEDHIVAWYFTDKGERKEILLSEEESLITPNPIFILDNAEDLSVEKDEVVQKIESVGNSRLQATNYNAYEVRINNRYEGSGKSEFAIHAIVIRTDGSTYSVFGNYEIFWSISKNDIGKTITPGYAYMINDIPLSYHYAYNTYERDWNNSSKGLGSSIGNGTTVTLTGRRRYSGEWYAWPNTSTNIPGAPLGDIDAAGTFGANVYGNTKGHLKAVH